MRNIWRRVVVVLKAAPTWLAAATATVTILSDELVRLLPDNLDTVVVQYAGLTLAVLGFAVTAIRRLTPVLPDERGLLPIAVLGEHLADPDDDLGHTSLE